MYYSFVLALDVETSWLDVDINPSETDGVLDEAAIGPVSNDSSPLKCLGEKSASSAHQIHRQYRRDGTQAVIVTYHPLSAPPLRKLQSPLTTQSHPPPTPFPSFQSGTMLSVDGERGAVVPGARRSSRPPPALLVLEDVPDELVGCLAPSSTPFPALLLTKVLNPVVKT